MERKKENIKNCIEFILHYIISIQCQEKSIQTMVSLLDGYLEIGASC